MNLERMKEVLADEAFVKELFTLETAQEVQEALSQKGVELTVEDIELIADLLNRYQAGELTGKEEKAIKAAQSFKDGELSDEELEEVAGGFGGLIMAAIIAVVSGAVITQCITEGRW